MGVSTARGLSSLGCHRIGLRAFERAPFVENCPGDASELVGERNCQHVAGKPLRCLRDPRPQTLSCRPWPSLEDNVCGLHKHAKSRPCLKPLPLPIAATTALETIGPMPGALMSRWQLSSCLARFDFGRYAGNAFIQSAPVLDQHANEIDHSWRQRVGFALKISGNALRSGVRPCRTVPRSSRKPRI